jgi:hypothetical protein
VRALSGALVALVLAGAAAVGVYTWQKRADPCFARCGEGTRCEAGLCRPIPPAPIAAAPAPHRRRRGVTHDGAPVPQLQPGDTKVNVEGDKLGRPGARLDLTGADDGLPSQLEQDAIDAVFDPERGAISQCLVDAVGDYPLERARVEVGFRVEPGGGVSKVRIESPQLLLRNHLAACIRPRVTGLRFPKASGATVATYPFELK